MPRCPHRAQTRKKRIVKVYSIHLTGVWPSNYLLEKIMYIMFLTKCHWKNINTTKRHNWCSLILHTTVYNSNLYSHLQIASQEFFVKIPCTCPNIHIFKNYPRITLIIILLSFMCLCHMPAKMAPIKLPLHI
jgi:hypothetical protein